MSWFKGLRERRERDREAIENSQALLAEALETDPDVEQMQRTAQEQLCIATKQAEKLAATDHSNHYSESLTHAFRGKLA